MAMEREGSQAPGQPFNLDAAVKQIMADVKQREEQAKTLDGIAHKVRTIEGLVCDENGVCRLPNREELSQVSESVKNLDEANKKVLEEIKQLSKYLSDQTKVPPGYIKEDEHKKMWKLLTECKEPGCGLDYIRKAMAKDFLTGVYLCTSDECKVLREKLQKEHGIEIRVTGKPEEKEKERRGSFLLSGK